MTLAKIKEATMQRPKYLTDTYVNNLHVHDTSLSFIHKLSPFFSFYQYSVTLLIYVLELMSHHLAPCLYFKPCQVKFVKWTALL